MSLVTVVGDGATTTGVGARRHVAGRASGWSSPSSTRRAGAWRPGSTCPVRRASPNSSPRRTPARGRSSRPAARRAPAVVEVLVAPVRAVEARAAVAAAVPAVVPVMAALDDVVVIADGGRAGAHLTPVMGAAAVVAVGPSPAGRLGRRRSGGAGAPRAPRRPARPCARSRSSSGSSASSRTGPTRSARSSAPTRSCPGSRHVGRGGARRSCRVGEPAAALAAAALRGRLAAAAVGPAARVAPARRLGARRREEGSMSTTVDRRLVRELTERLTARLVEAIQAEGTSALTASGGRRLGSTRRPSPAGAADGPVDGRGGRPAQPGEAAARRRRCSTPRRTASCAGWPTPRRSAPDRSSSS